MSEAPLLELLRNFHARGTRFVLIGVGGANYYATTGGSSFYTKDCEPPPAHRMRGLRRTLILCASRSSQHDRTEPCSSSPSVADT